MSSEEGKKQYLEVARQHKCPISYEEALRLAHQPLVNYKPEGWEIEWGYKTVVLVSDSIQIIVHQDGSVESVYN